MKKEREDELRAQYARGERVRRLLESPAWAHDLLPIMEAEVQHARASKIAGWAPGSKRTVDEIALTSAYCTGAEEGINRIAVRARELMERGALARKELEKEGIVL